MIAGRKYPNRSPAADAPELYLICIHMEFSCVVLKITATACTTSKMIPIILPTPIFFFGSIPVFSATLAFTASLASFFFCNTLGQYPDSNSDNHADNTYYYVSEYISCNTV